MHGFADQDWRGLARPGAVAAIYMGKTASRFVQGRLMMHGAAPDTPVTLVENASRHDQRVHAATLCQPARHRSRLHRPRHHPVGPGPPRRPAALPALKEA
jgi:uroporphyrin-III C-methyltransferase